MKVDQFFAFRNRGDESKPFLSHLEDLRFTIVKIAIALVLAMVACFLFRNELAAWLASEVPGYGTPPPVDSWDERRAYDTGWQKKLFDAGYAGINWPKEVGGRGASPAEHLIFLEETERRNVFECRLKRDGSNDVSSDEQIKSEEEPASD